MELSVLNKRKSFSGYSHETFLLRINFLLFSRNLLNKSYFFIRKYLTKIKNFENSINALSWCLMFLFFCLVASLNMSQTRFFSVQLNYLLSISFVPAILSISTILIVSWFNRAMSITINSKKTNQSSSVLDEAAIPNFVCILSCFLHCLLKILERVWFIQLKTHTCKFLVPKWNKFTSNFVICRPKIILKHFLLNLKSVGRTKTEY